MDVDELLEYSAVGNCNCETKTPEPKYHSKRCPVAMFGKMMELLQKNKDLVEQLELKQQACETWAKVADIESDDRQKAEAQVNALQNQVKGLREALMEIGKELSDDATLGYHKWAIDIVDQALQESDEDKAHLELKVVPGKLERDGVAVDGIAQESNEDCSKCKNTGLNHGVQCKPSKAHPTGWKTEKCDCGNEDNKPNGER